MIFQKENVTLNVSRFDSNGFWMGNCSEFVAKGTALGPEFTETIYTPSSIDMTACYEKSTNKWTEYTDKTNVEFRDNAGELYTIGKPDGELPDWAVTVEPPKYDDKTQSISYENEKWAVFDILVGESYFEADGKEHIIQAKNFTLPDGCTLQKPPVSVEGSVFRFINNEWKQLKDHRGHLVYNKNNCTKSKFVMEIGEIENGWTLEKPLPYSAWVDDKWIVQLDLLKQAKREEINTWRDAEEARTDIVVNVDDIKWNADSAARKRIESTLASSFIPPYWTDANDVDQPITSEQLQRVYTEIVKQGFLIHARQRAMKSDIIALSTIEAVNNYIVGWPD